GLHAAMMVHPAPVDMLRAKIVAASMFDVHCTGKESHASAFPIGSLPAVNHQPEFTRHCVTDQADKALCDGALAMAWTCIDLAMRREAPV
ncbi:MAG: hypothetical protein ACREUG_02815, partial [Steroidobacteraceae bacterium]